MESSYITLYNIYWCDLIHFLVLINWIQGAVFQWQEPSVQHSLLKDDASEAGI